MDITSFKKKFGESGRLCSVNSLGLLLFCIITAIFYVFAYARYPDLPHTSGHGWWAWFDQSYYLSAAKAWARGDLDPRYHWYLPGYALMAAPFVWLMPNHPFFLPDLICLLISLLLFAKLAERLGPHLRYPQLIGAAVFFITSVISVTNLQVWIIPWTTTGSVPLTFWSLLSALRFLDQDAKRDAFLSGLAGGCLTAFRPLDSAIVLIACAAGISFGTWYSHPRDWRRLVRSITLFGAGVALPLIFIVIIHLRVYGLRPSD
jgi:hypothetical protein